jgi:hypothetical protein
MVRDLNRTIAHIERTVTRNLDQRPSSGAGTAPVRPRKPAIRTWRASDSSASSERLGLPSAARQQAEVHFGGGGALPTLTARSVKVTIALDPAAVLELVALDGVKRVKFQIASDSCTLTTDVAAKSVRKAQTAIRTAGTENVFVSLLGKLVRGEIREAGLAAQVKATAVAEPSEPPATPSDQA